MMDRLCLSLVADQTTMHRHSHRDSLAASGMTKRYVRTYLYRLSGLRPTLGFSRFRWGAPHDTSVQEFHLSACCGAGAGGCYEMSFFYNSDCYKRRFMRGLC